MGPRLLFRVEPELMPILDRGKNTVHLLDIVDRKKTTYFTLLRSCPELHFSRRQGPILRQQRSLSSSQALPDDTGASPSQSEQAKIQNLEDAIKLSRIITQPHWDPIKPIEALEQSGLRLTPQVVAELIEMHSDPVLALRVFIWARRQEGYMHDSISRNALAQLWGSKRQFDVFLDIIDNTGNADVVLTPEQYLVLIKAYGWAGMVDEAIRVFEKMQSEGYVRGVAQFNAIFHVLVKDNRLKTMRLLYDQMVEAGISPNLVTYALRMRGFSRAGQGEEAFKLYREMIEKGLYPDVSTFGVLVDAICQMDRVQKIYQILYELLKGGSALDPAYYYTLIERLCNNGYAHEAKKLVDQLKIKNVPPTSRIYNILAIGFCRINKVHEAVMAMNEMMKNKFLPDVEVANVVITNLLTERKVKEALRFLDKVTDKGFTANIFTYDALIDGLCKCKELHKALGIWNTLVKVYVPDVKSSCVLLERLCHVRNFNQAKLVFKKMLEADCSHDILLECFKILRGGFRAAGRLDEARDLWHLMKERGGISTSNHEEAAKAFGEANTE